MAGLKGNSASSWVRGALYLSLAAFLVKGLSALYKVPYQNITGDIGYYVYQQVYPIYGVAFVLGSYGFPLVISRMLSEANSTSKEDQLNRIITIFLSLLLWNSAIGIMLILFANEIALVMGDQSLALAIRWLGLPFFLIPFLSVARGFYQSKENMVPTAVSQVVEQTIRIIVILVIASWAMNLGDPYLAGISAGIGAFSGSLFGIFMMSIYAKPSRWKWKRVKIQIPTYWKEDIKTLLTSSFLVSISAMGLIIFQLLDSFSVYRLLQVGGWSEESAATLKGIYDRGWPMVQLGAVVTTVFSYAAIPYITKAFLSGKMENVQTYISQSLKICIVFGGAATVGLISIMPNLNPMLFTDISGKGALQILSTTVLFSAIFMTVAALLHAVGQAVYASIILVIGIILKLVGNMLIVPSLGIEGAAIASGVSFFIMAIMSLIIINKRNLVKKISLFFFVKLLLSLSIMSVSVWSIRYGFGFFLQEPLHRGIHGFIAICSAIVGATIFILIIWFVKLFEKKEWENLPKVSKLLPYK
ncbi:oligosaccharide flippase family protein [Evansella sp. AB-rgal1]|uniref:putative polysaccharide biosynthesis protein n=1 Tax=Evansella sp. AB-rgal1 TaxID=3242696 RepID=UPI00359DDEDE